MKKWNIALAAGLLIQSGSTAFAQSSVEAYATQLTASAALLQLEEAAAARAILERTDPSLRGWEWNYLFRRTDHSVMTLRGHSGAVTSVAYFPDGRRLASSSSDSTVRIWELATGKTLHVLRGHEGGVSTVDVSADGSFIASGGRDRKVILWNAATGEVVRTMNEGVTQGVYQVRFHPDGRHLGMCSWEFKRPNVVGFGQVFDMQTGRIVRRVDGSGHPVSAIDFSPDGRTILIAGWGTEFIAAPFDSGDVLWNNSFASAEEYRAVQSAAYSPDGSLIVVGGKDHAVRVFNAKDGAMVRLIPGGEAHAKAVNAVRFSPDGKYFASTGDDGTVRVWTSDGERRTESFVGHTNAVNALAWSPAGLRIATGAMDSSIRIWDASPNRPYATFDVCNNGPWNASISWSGSLLAAPCSDTGYGLWDVRTGTRLKTLSGPSGNSAFFTPDEKTVVVSGWSGKSRVYDVASGKELGAFSGHTDGIVGSDYHAASGLVATASPGEKSVRVWKLATYEQVAKLDFSDAGPYRADFVPDGSRLIGASTRGSIKSWKTRGWTLENEAQLGIPVSHAETSPDGRLALFASQSGMIVVWNIPEWKEVLRATPHDREVYAVDFDQTGRRFVSAGYDQTVKIWDVDSMQPLVTLRGFRKHLYAVRFFDEGRKLVVVDTEGHVHVLVGDAVKGL